MGFLCICHNNSMGNLKFRNFSLEMYFKFAYNCGNFYMVWGGNNQEWMIEENLFCVGVVHTMLFWFWPCFALEREAMETEGSWETAGGTRLSDHHPRIWLQCIVSEAHVGSEEQEGQVLSPWQPMLNTVVSTKHSPMFLSKWLTTESWFGWKNNVKVLGDWLTHLQKDSLQAELFSQSLCFRLSRDFCAFTCSVLRWGSHAGVSLCSFTYTQISHECFLISKLLVLWYCRKGFPCPVAVYNSELSLAAVFQKSMMVKEMWMKMPFVCEAECQRG